MNIEYGVLGNLPFAATGTGEPLIVLAGLSPNTGVTGSTTVRVALGPLSTLASCRRLVLFNRRSGLPAGMTMAEFAAEQADALRAGFGDRAVDVVGMSTGGSIAQQIAADHPTAVRRLLLISTACRLGPFGQHLQSTAASQIRRGFHRRGLATLAAGLVPPRRGKALAALAASLLAPRLFKTDLDPHDMATTIEAEDGFDLARCPTVHAPTLLLAGREDRIYTPDLFEETARLIPNARLHLFDRCGHITVTRNPGFARELDAFLKPSSPSASA